MPALQLLPNEKLIYQTNPHLIFLVGPIAGLLLAWAVLWLGSCPPLAILDLASFCRLSASLAILLAIAVTYLDWRFNRFYFTSLRLVKERGIIGKRFTSVWLTRIQDLTCQFGFWGRILGFGDLLIESAGTYGQMNFKDLPSPLWVKNLIEETLASHPFFLNNKGGGKWKK